jgi:16S rRNA (adenine1518-N6/adenine1519-N6)-dimethyltransferase
MTASFTEPAKKHFGQNFLHDRSMIDKIVQAIDPKPGDAVVEIGPGQGALTFPLLQAARRDHRDRIRPRPARAAAGRRRDHGALHLIEGDVLGVDFTRWPQSWRQRAARSASSATCPTTSFTDPVPRAGPRAGDPRHALHAAEGGGRTHGRRPRQQGLRPAQRDAAGVLQRHSVVRGAAGRVPPAPKVDSAVVRLVPKPAESILVADRRVFANVVRAAFGQRRKTCATR